MKKVKHFKPILTKIGIDLLLHLSCNSVWPFITGHFVFCTSRAMGVHHCEQGKKIDTDEGFKISLFNIERKIR